MSEPIPGGAGCDTRDLLIVHRVFRMMFTRAPGLIETSGTDPKRHTLLDDHLHVITSALHRHHHGEDLILWDRLAERRPACQLHVDLMRAQHADVAHRLAQIKRAHAGWRSDRDLERRPLVAALAALRDALNAHLADEEQFVPETAGALLTQREWDELRDHGIATTPRTRLLIEIGYMLNAMETDEERTEFWHVLPGPVRVLYRLFGSRQLSKEMTALYGADEPVA
ncbi:MAG: hemerythrin domain-containing protein [Betaproteobacteria bacterium]|nr:hemerythrin domain-containing protein [Betaproteobacteria bacterium]